MWKTKTVISESPHESISQIKVTITEMERRSKVHVDVHNKSEYFGSYNFRMVMLSSVVMFECFDEEVGKKFNNISVFIKTVNLALINMGVN